MLDKFVGMVELTCKVGLIMQALHCPKTDTGNDVENEKYGLFFIISLMLNYPPPEILYLKQCLSVRWTLLNRIKDLIVFLTHFRLIYISPVLNKEGLYDAILNLGIRFKSVERRLNLTQNFISKSFHL